MVTISNILNKKALIPKIFHADIPTIIELSKSELSKDKEVISVINQFLKLINNKIAQPKASTPKPKANTPKPKFKINDRVTLDTFEAKVLSFKLNRKNEFVYKCEYINAPGRGSSIFEAKESDLKFYQPKASTPKAKAKTNTPKPKSSNDVFNVPVKDIFTDEKRFQNRAKLDQDIVNNIVENFSATEFDPIIVWKDPKAKKTFVLGGHHRFEAVNKLKHKTVQVKFFNGTEAEAIYYAKVKSNANRTLEKEHERAKIYRNLRLKGISKKAVLEEAKKVEGKNATVVLNLSYLKEDGITIQSLQKLDNADKKNKSTFETIANWIGEALRMHEQLNYTHEKEMYDFLMDAEQSKRIKNKEEFVQKITAIAGGFDFDGTQPLNLKRLKYASEGENVYEQEYKEIQSKIDSILDKKVSLKEQINALISSGKTESQYKEQLERFEEVSAKLNEEIKFFQSKKLELMRNKGKYTSAGQNQAALFGVKKPKLNAPVPTVKTIGAIKPISDTGKQQNNFFKVNGNVGKFLQQVERKPFESVVITLDGMQGAGKTTTLYKFIDAFGSAGNSCLFISGEEHPESALAVEKRDKYLSNEAKKHTAIVGDVESVEQLYQYVKPYDIIFIDSWQKLQRMVGNIRLDEDLRKKFNGKVFVVIFQQTTTGRTKGGAEVVFDGDIIIKMVKEASFADNYAYFDKNRYTKIPIENIRYNIAKGTVYNPNAPEVESSPTPGPKTRVIIS